MIKTSMGETEFKGEFTEIMADYMMIQDSIISYLLENFKEHAVFTAFMELAEIARDTIKDNLDYDESAERLDKTLESLAENRAKTIGVELKEKCALEMLKELLETI